MRKYTDAPKDIADVIRNGMTVSRDEAFGDDWKKLPVGRVGTPAKAGKRIPANLARRVAATKKKVLSGSSPKIKTPMPKAW